MKYLKHIAMLSAVAEGSRPRALLKGVKNMK